MDVSTIWDFCGEVVGSIRPKTGYVPATVTRIDNDGTVWAGTTDGILVSEIEEHGQVIETFAERVHGRYPVADILDPVTGEVLFTTGLIPPGLYCNKVVLSRPLETGTYACTMIVQPYFIREVPTPTTNAVFDIKVSVF